ncbi:MAG: diadenylate cyclase CdaA [Gemmatimonadota bacterium]|nr:diadenylate cyclase CdaA [Gemmatimonadota bacterium]
MINPISLLSLNWQSYFDILIVAILIYSLYVWVRGTRAFQILVGLGGLGLLYGISSWSGLFLTSWLLQYLLGIILLLAIVIFQPEIRQLLEKVSPLAIIRLKGGPVPRANLAEIAEASFFMADQRIGGLLVVPRATPISDAIQDGIQLDSLVTQEMLVSIFQKSSPMHDGAVIIEKNRMTKAGCYLPLSTREGLPPKYGTRHRAALGISEHRDTLCVVISEERGVVSLTRSGEIETMTGEDQLRQNLESALLPQIRAKSSIKESVVQAITSRLNYRELMQKNLVAKFMALGLSFLLWFVLVGQQWSEISLTAVLEYQNMPANMDIVSNPVNEIQVRVRGPRGSISILTPDQVRVMIDLNNVVPGSQTIDLTEDNLRLPFGVETTFIEPRSWTMEFDRLITRRLIIDYDLIGELPEGLELTDVVVDPPSIEFPGRENELKQIKQVITTPPIDLSQITDSQIIRTNLKIIPSLPYRFPTPEVMVSLSLMERVIPEEDSEQPVSENDEGLSSSDASTLVRLVNRVGGVAVNLPENPLRQQ